MFKAFTGWLREWIAPSPFWKAVEPIVAAVSIFILASKFDPLLTASSNHLLINLIPSNEIPSAIGWKPGAQYASKLWANASIPVAAVILAGSPTVKTGSKITIEGKNLGWKIIFLTFVSSFNITDALPVSEPVPAVVGTAIIGAILSELAFAQLSPTSSNSQIGKFWPDIKAIAFPTSNPLPPPKAITPSQLFFL